MMQRKSSVKESKYTAKLFLVELKGTSPIGKNSRNMPYGLNHRKSLENLVPSGNLRIYNATQNYEPSKRSPNQSRLSVEKI